MKEATKKPKAYDLAKALLTEILGRPCVDDDTLSTQHQYFLELANRVDELKKRYSKLELVRMPDTAKLERLRLEISSHQELLKALSTEIAKRGDSWVRIALAVLHVNIGAK